jgi:hypothetical protein
VEVMQLLTKTLKKKSGSKAVSVARGFRNRRRVQSSAKDLDRVDKIRLRILEESDDADCGFSKYACKTIQTSMGGISFRINLANVFCFKGGERHSTQR